jgi:phosphohistidine swiveling domain-containing protein
MTPRPRCVPLDALGDTKAGGKAEGLAALAAMGLSVPPAFVILDALPSSLPSELTTAYAALGRGPVAVRSSALDEDAADASFAGQHETVLGVEGDEALRAAVVECLASLGNRHAAAYRESRGKGEGTMAVVVQRMVAPRAAGVLFTVDPVSARRDRLVIDAVPGLGDSLVSGHKTPDHYLIDREGRVLRRELEYGEPVLDERAIAALVEGARHAERVRGVPLDMEWAIDEAGNVHWLQARPITELAADPRELDTPTVDGHVYTRCNIGEMMPGAITPLTWSLSGRAIEYGVRYVYQAIGAYPSIEEQPPLVSLYFGHLFFDLTAMAAVSRHIGGTQPQQTVMAICGRNIPEVIVEPPKPKLVRARNAARYALYLATARPRWRSIRRLIDRFRMPVPGSSAAAIWSTLEAERKDLGLAYGHHLISSMIAGAAAPALLEALARGGDATEAQHAEVAALLAHAEGVESHAIATGIDDIIARFVEQRSTAEHWLALGPDEALAWLHSDQSPIGIAFRFYLQRHGHRSVREAELRQREWARDPSPLVLALRGGVRARLDGRAAHTTTTPSKPPLSLRPLVALGHVGVRSREQTKSLVIRLTVLWKHAYWQLATALVDEGLLPDADLVYFLLHEEVGKLAQQRDPVLVHLAQARRKAHALQKTLRFDDVVVGAPEPLTPEPPSGARVLHGKPVSRGIARGLARVALSPEEARDVQPGEILIAPITDVGWTPCFSLIAGLACDIGSAVSHGAVVAREYGLPAVVNLRTATQTFRTGDRVVLDADAGVLRIDED